MPSQIPSFYCCYLLRSTTKPKATPYIGSTPNILRRWKQHNSMLPGGAVTTSREAYQPWEVLCIVHGFTSRNAALQFEWAWQHPHSTRHIDAASRAGAAVTATATKKTSAKGSEDKENEGSPAKKRQGNRTALRRPPATITQRLSHLHILLRTPSFFQWPLQLTFFSEIAYDAWHLWDSREPARLRPGIRITTDFRKDTVAKKPPRAASPTKPVKSSQSPTKTKPKREFPVPVVLTDWDFKYDRFKEHLKMGMAVSGKESENNQCQTCHGRLNSDEGLVVICPESSCAAAFHLTCLASCGDSALSPDQVVPHDISCPSCATPAPWTSFVTELCLRAYHPQLVQKILGKRRKGQDASQAPFDDEGYSEAEFVFDEDDFWAAERESDDSSLSDADKGLGDDDFIDIDDLPSPKMLSTQQSSTHTQSRNIAPIRDTIVIPDSDWDDVEVLE